MQSYRKVVPLILGAVFLVGCGSKPAPPGPAAPSEPVATNPKPAPAEQPKPAETQPAQTPAKPEPKPVVTPAPKPKPGNRSLKMLPGPITPELLGLPFPPGAEMITSECAAVEMNGTRTVRAVFTTPKAPAEVQKFYQARAKVTSKEEIEIEGSPAIHFRGSSGPVNFDISATVPQGSDRARVKIETTRPAP